MLNLKMKPWLPSWRPDHQSAGLRPGASPGGRSAGRRRGSPPKVNRMVYDCLALALLLLACGPTRAEDRPPAAANASDTPAPPGAPRKKILFFSKCNEYEDSMIRRTNGQLSPAEEIMSELGKQNRLAFTFTKDGSMFTPETMAKFDAFCFFTSGDLTQPGSDGNPPITAAGKAALLQAIQEGKGFIGIHSAADTFNSGAQGVDPYIKMLGGELKVRVRGMGSAHQILVDTNFPGMNSVPADFAVVEEWYALRNFSTNLHVLLMQDTASMSRGSYYAPNYPSTWAQKYGQGRVFYTSMGHQKEVWLNPVFQQLLTGGVTWAAGLVEADVTPNIDKVAPGVSKQ